MCLTKLLIFPVEIRIFCPKTTKIGIFGQFGPGHAGLFNALLVGRLVVVARGLYLARHLFTLSLIMILCKKNIVPPPLETCLPRTIQRTTLFESLPNSLHNSFNKLSQRRKTWKHFPVQINCTQVLQQHSYGGGVSMSMPEHKKNS